MKAFYATGSNGSFIAVEENGEIRYADTVSGDTSENMPASEALDHLANIGENAEPMANPGDFSDDEMAEYVGSE